MRLTPAAQLAGAAPADGGLAPDATQACTVLEFGASWAGYMDAKEHWDRVYATKRASEVSWYEPNATTSMRLIHQFGGRLARIIDVGAGESELIGVLLDAGYRRPVWLDLSQTAFEHSRARLGPRSSLVEWIVADVTKRPVLPEVDLWHDRAVLHFLTDVVDQQAYARVVAATVRRGGHVVVATFAPGGPKQCSGLPVQRYDGRSVASLLGPDFELLEEQREVHRTPAGAKQKFCWSVLRRRMPAEPIED